MGRRVLTTWVLFSYKTKTAHVQPVKGSPRDLYVLPKRYQFLCSLGLFLCFTRSDTCFKSAFLPFFFLFSFVSAGVKYLGAVAQLGASSAAPSNVSVNQVATFHSSSRAYQGIASQHVRQMTSGLSGPGPLDIFPLYQTSLEAAKRKEQKEFYGLFGCKFVSKTVNT